MTSNRSPLDLVFFDPNEASCVSYHRHFRNEPHVEIRTAKITDVSKPLPDGTFSYDVLLLPIPNCHGIIPSHGYIREIMTWLGLDFMTALKQKIEEEHSGEMLPGSSLIITTNDIQASSNQPEISKSEAPSKAESVPTKEALGKLGTQAKTTGSSSGLLAGFSGDRAGSFGLGSLSDMASAAALIPSKGHKNFKAIIVVCAFRVLTPSGDSMAWLDPIYIHEDWAYNGFKSGIEQAIRYNKLFGTDEIRKVLVPDWNSLRSNSIDPQSQLPSVSDNTAKQISLAWKNIITHCQNMCIKQSSLGSSSPSLGSNNLRESDSLQLQAPLSSASSQNLSQPKRAFTWADAILLQRLLLNKDKSSESGASVQSELLTSLSSGELEKRGIYSLEELQVACQWVRDPTNPERQLSGAKLIANAFSQESSQYGVSKADVARVVTNKDTGCLPSLLNFVQQGLVKLYVEIPPEDLVYGDEIGTGTAGSVVKATWKGKPVAVKKFKGVDLGDFLKELSIMSIVQHQNLVECYGGCTRNKDTMYIVQELMDANISDILRMKPITLDLGIRLKIAIEVAKGVSFLHTHCNLIHRDLKSLNLLTTVGQNDLTVKVCDFGVSRVVDRRKTMTGNVGTVSWIAPEVFEQRKYTEKADVYSFGIVLWELYTRKVPFADIHSFSIPVAVIKGDRPSIPKDCPSTIKKLIRECWQPKASKRPTFAKIIEILTKILEQTPPSQKTQTTINLTPLYSMKKKNSTLAPYARNRATYQSNEDSGPLPTVSASSAKHEDIAGSSQSPGTSPATSPVVKRKKVITDSAGNPLSPTKSSREITPPPAADTTKDANNVDTSNKTSKEDFPTDTNTETAVSKSDKPVKKPRFEDEEGVSSSPHTTSSTTLDSESPDDLSTSYASSLSSSPSSSTLSLARRQLSVRDSSILPQPQHTRTVTCTVPDKWAPPIAKLEIQVNKYFSKLKQDLEHGTIMVNNERYLLFRAKSLSVDFLNLVQTSFSFDHPEQSLEFAQNFLYDLGTAIGKNDARNFLASSGIDDPVARNNAGLVHVAYTGMAFVNLRPESVYSKYPEDECLLYEYTYSFESDSWLKRGNISSRAESSSLNSAGFTPPPTPHSDTSPPTDFCTCMMSAGYMSGWGEGATGHVRATAEILCRAKGDHQCLFVRSAPFRLESMVKKVSNGTHDPLPRFLKNRSDTMPASMRTKSASAPTGSVLDQADEEEASWFQKGFRQLFKRVKKSNHVDPGMASPNKTPKFNTKALVPPELPVDEIEKRAAQELNSFFIDPTTATVEMADERCVLLSGDSLAYGFFSLVEELFGKDAEEEIDISVDSKQLSKQFAWKFLFDLGKTTGTSNHSWFAEKIGIPANPIDRINSLPVNMAYFGWCDLVIKSGATHKEISKAKENFVVLCEVSNSFEAASWIKNRKEETSCVCYMHSGYLAGWFESSLNTSVVCVETACRAQGARTCQFTIAHSNNIKKILSGSSATTGLNTATTVGVLPLLAKFKEKRRESTPLKFPPSFNKSITIEAGQKSPSRKDKTDRLTDSPKKENSKDSLRSSKDFSSPSKKDKEKDKEKEKTRIPGSPKGRDDSGSPRRKSKIHVSEKSIQDDSKEERVENKESKDAKEVKEVKEGKDKDLKRSEERPQTPTSSKKSRHATVEIEVKDPTPTRKSRRESPHETAYESDNPTKSHRSRRSILQDGSENAYESDSPTKRRNKRSMLDHDLAYESDSPSRRRKSRLLDNELAYESDSPQKVRKSSKLLDDKSPIPERSKKDKKKLDL